MEANAYQLYAARFDNHIEEMIDGTLSTRGLAAALGLAAEAGEVANEYERALRYWVVVPDGDWIRPVDDAKVIDELGDVLWNVARLASSLGITLEQIMQLNIEKLAERYAERGIPVDESR